MEQFFKKALISLALIIAGTTLYTAPTYAAAVDVNNDNNCRNFLGMQSWDCHTVKWDKEENLRANILIIASNILVDFSVIAAYLVIGYVVYGGYLYMFSSGDPSKAASGKKTLTHAFIGLAIVMLSNVILNATRLALLGSTGSFATDCTQSSCVDPADLITNTLNWFIAIAGVVSIVFVVVGGIGYVTSSGDPGKLKKAKDTIIYSLIGLAIVALAEVIVIFVSNTIRDAEARIEPTTIIAKEYYEN